MPIIPVTAAPVTQVAMLSPTSTGSKLSGATDVESQAGAFQSVFAEAVQRVQDFQATSQATIGEFLAGADVDLHQVAITVQKAETSFELFAEVRNKVVQAYQEIMRMQV